MATVAQYRAMAAQALLELADGEGAFVAPEAEAKISEAKWPSLPRTADPHHVTAALNDLVRAGQLISSVDPTRGGRSIRTFHLPVERGRARKIEDASGRKRLLHTRYVGWATGTQAGGQGSIGPGLEFVVHRSLQAAAQFGYHLFNPTSPSGEVRTLFGEPTPGGAMDNGALLSVLNEATLVADTYVTLFEAKNLRQWMYPRTQELHQLLSKAATIQVQHPELKIVPVLVCRRANYLTFKMAEQLGFYVIQTYHQYVRPSLGEGTDATHLAEVNAELAYDLVPEEGPVDPMVRHFRHQIPLRASGSAARWAVTAPAAVDVLAELRNPALNNYDRAEATDQLADVVERAHGGEPVEWRSTAD